VLGDFTTTTRLLPISAVAVGIGVVAAFVALALLRLIGFFTNLFYFRRWSAGRPGGHDFAQRRSGILASRLHSDAR
jgi:hypothetical protein